MIDPAPARREPETICIECGGPLDETGPAERRCPAGHRWPVVAGILDCRSEIPGFDLEEDRAVALDLHRNRHLRFEELLRQYWQRVGLHPRLAERHVRGDLVAEARATEVADQIDASIGGGIRPGMIALEVGGGTAALGAELAGRLDWVVLSDISLAWLVLAAKRLQSRSTGRVTLLAATATSLPYRSGTFDLVIAADVVEHVPDVEAMVDECMRVARQDGRLWLSTPNRYSLTMEPHVRVWGVGFLPRRWAGRYVRAVRGVDYHGIRTLSLLDLKRLGPSRGVTAQVETPRVPAALLPNYSKPVRALIRLFNLLRRVPLVAPLLLWVSPYYHVVIARDLPRPRNQTGSFPASTPL